jgi:hypothetical protein
VVTTGRTELAVPTARGAPAVHELARRVVADLPELEHDSAEGQAIRAFLRRLQGAPTDHETHALLREQATQRAEEGVPLPVLLRTYTTGARVLFEALRREARPDEAAALTEAAALLLAVQDEVLAEVARAYQHELAALGSAQHDRRRELARDLVVNRATPDPAALEEFRLGAGATVVALRLGALCPPDADKPPRAVRPDLGAEAAVRRQLHRLHQEIDRYFGQPVPALLELTGGHLLVPRTSGGATGSVPSVSGEFIRRLAEVWGDEVCAAVEVAQRPEQIGEAAGTAAEVLRLVGALGRPPGVYALEDVLLEYHLTRQDESVARLTALLDPLAERPDLLHTVRIYLEEGYDRRRTARRLGLHPNTVDNRLARVTELTGLDPASPRSVALLVTTLALRDLR